MIHKSDGGNPAAQQQLRTVFSTRGMSMSKQKGPSVKVHGLTNLDEALQIKSILEEKGLDSAVTLQPGDFEYLIKVKGHEPFSFEVKFPIDFNIDEARSVVDHAVSVAEKDLGTALAAIYENKNFAIVADELCEGIRAARAYLDQVEKKTIDTTSSSQPNNLTDMNNTHTTAIVAAATNQSMEAVQAAQSNHDNSLNQSEENQTTMNTNQQTTTNEASTAAVDTIVNNAGAVQATEQTTGNI